jgi:hypothetical protein
LTQAISWRWCLYVNLVIAVPTSLVALRLLVNQRPPERARIDIPGVLTWTLGLFALVFGFSNAETHGWGATATVVALIASPLLLTTFVLIERRVKYPLMPLHIPWDRARGGSYTALLMTGAGIFAVFLFLTYFLQVNLRFSPLKTGVAFLPLRRCSRQAAASPVRAVLSIYAQVIRRPDRDRLRSEIRALLGDSHRFSNESLVRGQASLSDPEKARKGPG